MHRPNFFRKDGHLFVVVHNITVPVKFRQYPQDRDERISVAEGEALRKIASFLNEEFEEECQPFKKGVWNEPGYKFRFEFAEFQVLIDPIFPDTIQVQCPGMVQRVGTSAADRFRKDHEARAIEVLGLLHRCFSFDRRF